MGGLLKYAFVLGLGIAIGAYIVLEPLSLDDISRDAAERNAATPEPGPSATLASIEEEELEYTVAKRVRIARRMARVP